MLVHHSRRLCSESWLRTSLTGDALSAESELATTRSRRGAAGDSLSSGAGCSTQEVRCPRGTHRAGTNQNYHGARFTNPLLQNGIRVLPNPRARS